MRVDFADFSGVFSERVEKRLKEEIIEAFECQVDVEEECYLEVDEITSERIVAIVRNAKNGWLMWIKVSAYFVSFPRLLEK